MRIWIDLVNSPHVPFFIPLIKRFEEQGHSVSITYRDFAQTKALVEHFGINAELIGGHGGKSKLGKIGNLVSRTISLIKFGKKRNFDLALSHNSYFQLIAAKCLRLKAVTSMDFEGQPANHLAFRLADLVIVPSVFPKQALGKFGANKSTVYQGFKEDICLADFEYQKDFYEEVKSAFSLSEEDLARPVVVVRPPPTLALYHNGQESVFDALMDKLNGLELTVLVLPRVAQQKMELQKKFKQFHFSDVPLDGLQLVALADAVISGGGSMNREAACLGTPAYSVFSGPLPAVDRALAEQGRLQRVESIEQVRQLNFVKKESQQHIDINQAPIDSFLSDCFEEIKGK